MAVIKNDLTPDFFEQREGKIFKAIEIKGGRKFHKVKSEIHPDDKNETQKDLIIYNSDAKSRTKVFIKRIPVEDVRSVELFETEEEMMEVFSSFDLRPPSYFLEMLLVELSSIRKRKHFDIELESLIGENEFKRLSAALWILSDPEIKEKIAWSDE